MAWIRVIISRSEVADVVLLSSPTFSMVVGATHQAQAEARLADGSPAGPGYPLTWSSSDGAKATVDSTGLITAVASGNVVITAEYGAHSVTIDGTVTGPFTPVVVTVDLSTYALAVTTGNPAPISAIPKDATGQLVVGAAVTWEETTGTGGDVALGPDSGTDAHTTQVTGITPGLKKIRALCDGIYSTECDVTVTASTDFVDSLGYSQTMMPASWLPRYARAYGSTKSVTGGPVGVRASGSGGPMGDTVGDPWMKNESEFFDNNALTENLRIITDLTVPLQKVRGHALLYGAGGATRCAFMEVKHGQVGGNSFAKATPFPTTQTSRWPAGWQINQKYRQMYHGMAIKIRVDMPTLNQGFSKLDFWQLGYSGLTQVTNAAMFQIPFGSGIHLVPPWTYGPVTPVRLGSQGMVDFNINDAHILTTAFWNNPANTARTDQSDGGVPVILDRGDWYRFVEIYRTHTFNGSPSTSRDGYVILGIQKLLSTGIFGISEDVWSQLVLVAGPAGWAQLLAGANPPNQAPETAQSYVRGIEAHHQLNIQPFLRLDERWGPSGAHNIVSLVTFPYQIHGTGIYSLSPGAVCVPPAGAQIPAGLWGAFRIDANAAGALVATWFTNGGTGYSQPSQAEIAARSQPLVGYEYVGYVSLQAGANTWVSGTDAFAGQTGGTPAVITKYLYSTGLHRAYDFVGAGEIEP